MQLKKMFYFEKFILSENVEGGKFAAECVWNGTIS